MQSTLYALEGAPSLWVPCCLVGCGHCSNDAQRVEARAGFMSIQMYLHTFVWWVVASGATSQGMTCGRTLGTQTPAEKWGSMLK
jgi:hypothetical protein